MRLNLNLQMKKVLIDKIKNKKAKIAIMRAIGLKPIGECDKILKEKFPNRWWRTD